jgi:hypothetical protein
MYLEPRLVIICGSQPEPGAHRAGRTEDPAVHRLHRTRSVTVSVAAWANTSANVVVPEQTLVDDDSVLAYPVQPFAEQHAFPVGEDGGLVEVGL